MKWNTQQKAAVAVLALASAAFCVDRFVLGYGPRAASAAPPIGTAETAASSPASEKVGAGGSASSGNAVTRTASLAERVAMLAPVTSAADPAPSTPDAFAIPSSWAALVRAPETSSDTVAPAAPVSSKDGVTFVLSSVMAGPHVPTPAARINGHLIKVGEKISGHELLRIESEPGKDFVAVLQGREPGDEIRVPLARGGESVPAPTPGPGAHATPKKPAPGADN